MSTPNLFPPKKILVPTDAFLEVVDEISMNGNASKTIGEVSKDLNPDLIMAKSPLLIVPKM